MHSPPADNPSLDLAAQAEMTAIQSAVSDCERPFSSAPARSSSDATAPCDSFRLLQQSEPNRLPDRQPSRRCCNPGRSHLPSRLKLLRPTANAPLCSRRTDSSCFEVYSWPQKGTSYKDFSTVFHFCFVSYVAPFCAFSWLRVLIKIVIKTQHFCNRSIGSLKSIGEKHKHEYR